MPLPAHMPDAHRLAVLVSMMMRVAPHQASAHNRRMQRKRLIRPRIWRRLPGMMIRRRLASGVGARLPDAAQAPYLAYDSGIFCRHDKTRQRRIRR
ncbi:hypothetical protein ACLB1Q_12955 [Escherichia coli]